MLKHRVHNPPHVAGASIGSDNSSGSQHDLRDDFPAPPSDLDLFNNEQDTKLSRVNNEQCGSSITNPLVVVPSSGRQSDEQNPHYVNIKHPMETSPNTMSTSQGVMSTSQGVMSTSQGVMSTSQGVRAITGKYDQTNNLSPLSSPSCDGVTVSFTDMVMSQKFREGVTESDLLQVDTFYRSHKSEVYVCGCLVNMYFGSAKASLMNDQWTFSSTGIPLLLLDTGEHHRKRKLSILIAEKGTGFTLWRDVIDNLTGYRTPNVNFHTMHISTDHTKLAGFSFDEAGAASEFYNYIKKLTSDPEDELLKTGNCKKKKSIKDKKKKTKLPKKTEISNPCCFVHVTKLEPEKVVGLENENNHAKQPSNSSEISAPFNFQHVTAPSGTECTVELRPNMIESNMTLTSSSSVDSCLSEGRSST